MPETRRTRRTVTLNLASAARLLQDLSDGLSRGDLVVEGSEGRILLTPGAEVQIRVSARPARKRLQVRLSWERLRTLRERPAAGASPVPPPPASPRRPASPARPGKKGRS